MAHRHLNDAARRKEVERSAHEREDAWLLARLCERLQPTFPPPALVGRTRGT